MSCCQKLKAIRVSSSQKNLKRVGIYWQSHGTYFFWLITIIVEPTLDIMRSSLELSNALLQWLGDSSTYNKSSFANGECFFLCVDSTFSSFEPKRVDVICRRVDRQPTPCGSYKKAMSSTLLRLKNNLSNTMIHICWIHRFLLLGWWNEWWLACELRMKERAKQTTRHRGFLL